MEKIGIEQRIVNKLTKAIFENEESIELFFTYQDAEGLRDLLSEYVQEAFDEDNAERENEIESIKKSIFEIEKSIDLLMSKEIEKTKRYIDKLGNIL